LDCQKKIKQNEDKMNIIKAHDAEFLKKFRRSVFFFAGLQGRCKSPENS